MCFSCGSVSSKAPALSRGLWVVGKQPLTPGSLQPFAGSGGFAGEDVLCSGPHVPSPSPSLFPGCSSFSRSPPGCSFYPSAASQPHHAHPLLPAFWGPFFPPFFIFYLVFCFFFCRASVTNANTCRSRQVKACRISVASATLPRSNPVVIPLSAHPRRLWLLFKGSKWDR